MGALPSIVLMISMLIFIFVKILALVGFCILGILLFLYVSEKRNIPLIRKFWITFFSKLFK